MKTGLYTKAMLTVIAMCLVWMSLGGPSLLVPVQAQTVVPRVVIAGWESNGDNVTKGLPCQCMTTATECLIVERFCLYQEF